MPCFACVQDELNWRLKLDYTGRMLWDIDLPRSGRRMSLFDTMIARLLMVW